MDNNPQPDDSYWTMVKPVWWEITIHEGPEVFLRQYRRVPPGVGHLFAAHWCQSEVRNGGFHQFFFNHTGVLAPEALAGFRAIGLREWASLLEVAMRFFGEPYPRERDVRRERLAGVAGDDREDWDPFTALDDRFFAWMDADEHGWRRSADAYASKVRAEQAPER